MRIRPLRQIQRDIKKISQNLGPLQGFVDEAVLLIRSPRIRRSLSYALEWFRPHLRSMGVRISRLSLSQVEVVLPSLKRNSDERGDTLDGVVIAAALQAHRFLWQINSPEGNVQFKITGLNWQAHGRLHGELRVRAELKDLTRENFLLELNSFKQSKQKMLLFVLSAEEQIRAELEVDAEFYLVESLDWK